MGKQRGFSFLGRLRTKLHIIVFGTETSAGRRFDVVLLWIILASIVAVMLESVRGIEKQYHTLFSILEWSFTIIFTIEYGIRLLISHRPLKYALSFYGIIDLLATIPSYLALFLTGGGYLVVIRAVRLLRVFRILKLTRQLSEARMLIRAMKASRHKILVFMGAVAAIVTIMGTLMYMLEGEENGFTSIPQSIYWAIVTVTTVGYGDIAPSTVLGQVFASALMLMGYAIIAVPTGIVTAEIAAEQVGQSDDKLADKPQTCHACHTHDHGPADRYCRHCGEKFQA